MENPNPKISEETTTASEKIGSIEDLLEQIFAHIPKKPLIRFKLVSKQWNSIITARNKRVVSLIFRSYQDTRVVSYFSSNPLPQIVLPHHLTIFHSCNGKFILKNTVSRKHEYYVYSPATTDNNNNNKKPTPLLIKDDEKAAREQDWVCGMYLAFDPSKSLHYKVVCVRELDWLTNNKNKRQYQFEVYSSETGSWETRGVWFPGGSVDFNNGVYWNGAIHWAGSFPKINFYFHPEHDEVPSVMPAMPVVGGFYFGESCGHLHCCAEDQRVGEMVDVYEMSRDYSEWFVKYRVKVKSVFSEWFRESESYKVYGLVRGKRDEDSFLVFGRDEREARKWYELVRTCQTVRGRAIYVELCDMHSVKSFLCFE